MLVEALFKSQTLLFVSASSLFSLSYLYRVTVFEKFLNVFSCLKQNNGEKILRNSESFIAMTHDGNCWEDFLYFGHSQVFKSPFCLCFFTFLLCD